jgi:hypothetical protein
MKRFSDPGIGPETDRAGVDAKGIKKGLLKRSPLQSQHTRCLTASLGTSPDGRFSKNPGAILSYAPIFYYSYVVINYIKHLTVDLIELYCPSSILPAKEFLEPLASPILGYSFNPKNPTFKVSFSSDIPIIFS